METVKEIIRPLVLVAEDDESNFKLIHAIIGSKCEVKWARTGVEMLKLFDEYRDRAELLLMDIKMPEMNGLEATAAIRKIDQQVPIVVQTAYAFDSDYEQALKVGVNAVLVKPITLAALRGTVSDFLPYVVW